MLFSSRISFSLLSTQAPIKKYTKILKSDCISQLFEPYIEVNSGESLSSIMNNAYVAPLPASLHGMNTITKKIIINLRKFTSDDVAMEGYRLIVLLREIGHYLVRKDCNSSQAILEYESDSTNFTPKSSQNKKKVNAQPESGNQVEEILFGKKLRRLNEVAAKFAMEPKNWGKKNFKTEFQKLNKQIKYPDGSMIPSTLMKKTEYLQGVVDFSGNWCRTSTPWWVDKCSTR